MTPNATQYDPELVERMVALVWCITDYPLPIAPATRFDMLHDEALAIAALLPEPVDPDLLEARQMAATRGDDVDAGILAGVYDDGPAVAYRLAGIKRGRELAAAQGTDNG